MPSSFCVDSPVSSQTGQVPRARVGVHPAVARLRVEGDFVGRPTQVATRTADTVLSHEVYLDMLAKAAATLQARYEGTWDVGGGVCLISGTKMC